MAQNRTAIYAQAMDLKTRYTGRSHVSTGMLEAIMNHAAPLKVTFPDGADPYYFK